MNLDECVVSKAKFDCNYDELVNILDLLTTATSNDKIMVLIIIKTRPASPHPLLTVVHRHPKGL